MLSTKQSAGLAPHRRPNVQQLRLCATLFLLLTFGRQPTGLHAAAAEFRAGAASVNITPPLGIGLAGYYVERGADGTNDDLFSKALVLDVEGVSAAQTVIVSP